MKKAIKNLLDFAPLFFGPFSVLSACVGLLLGSAAWMLSALLSFVLAVVLIAID